MIDHMRRYGGSLLLLVLAFAYLTRMYQLNIPEHYMFDEVYHAMTAKLIAQNNPQAYEWWNPPPEPDTAVEWLHPPLAKYFQALSILAFGENSFGWRFSSVVFGMLVIVITYHLTKLLFEDETIALAAAGLSSLDGLLLVQSRIAMNDIFVVFFILLTLFLYVKFKKNRTHTLLLLVGISAGLSVATKWSGLFVLCVVWLFELLHLIAYLIDNDWKMFNSGKEFKQVLQKVVIYFLALLVVPIIVYIASYTQMFLQGKDWAHFRELHNQIWYYQTHLKATHPYQSRPWQWALDLRPVWYYVDYQTNKRADVYAFGNPLLFLIGLAAILYNLVIGTIWVIQMWSIKSKWKKNVLRLLQHCNKNPLFLVITAYWFVWLPWELSPRIMFFYHYAPAVPLLCIVLATSLVYLFRLGGMQRKLSLTIWALTFICFVAWYPHWVGIPVSTSIKDQLYFALQSWK